MTKKRIVRDYVDSSGVKRREETVDQSAPLGEGIPRSVQLEELLERGVSESTLKTLYTELHARGLIEPADFLKPHAIRDIQSALMGTLKLDAGAIQRLAKDQQRKK